MCVSGGGGRGDSRSREGGEGVVGGFGVGVELVDRL